jgi:hypothetical protein
MRLVGRRPFVESRLFELDNVFPRLRFGLLSAGKVALSNQKTDGLVQFALSF